ncbi:MAG TPA: SufE family protein [Aliidiomarina sp.]|nr:SufE family protein [Aliidiomarina sp.]
MTQELTPQASALMQQLSDARGWEKRYRELLLIGKHANTPATIRSDLNQVSGCQAKVWLAVERNGHGLHIETDSDSRLVKALLIVLTAPLQQQPIAYLQSFDFKQWLEQCLLADHLSESRVNGLHQMILALQQKALLA